MVSFASDHNKKISFDEINGIVRSNRITDSMLCMLSLILKTPQRIMTRLAGKQLATASKLLGS